MTPKTYLISLGTILLLVSILSVLHIVGPTPENSVFGSTWFFNNIENIGHSLVGIGALLAAFYVSKDIQRKLCLISAFAGVAAGLYSLFISQMILGAHFENPADTIFHLVIGICGFIAYRHRHRILNHNK